MASAWGNARPASQAASNATGVQRSSQALEVPGELGLLVIGHVGAGGLADRSRGTQQARGPIGAPAFDLHVGDVLQLVGDCPLLAEVDPSTDRLAVHRHGLVEASTAP